MKSFIILFLLNFIVINTKEDYTINTFLNYLKDNKLYEILVMVKTYLGDDIAISLCKDFVPSNHCEEVVKVYIVVVLKETRSGGDDNITVKKILNYNYPNLLNFLGQKKFNEIYNKY